MGAVLMMKGYKPSAVRPWAPPFTGPLPCNRSSSSIPVLPTYTYLLFDEASREALIIDPVDTQLERDLAARCASTDSSCCGRSTPTPADHITSAGLLAGAPESAHRGAGRLRHRQCRHAAADGEMLAFGSQKLRRSPPRSHCRQHELLLGKRGAIAISSPATRC